MCGQLGEPALCQLYRHTLVPYDRQGDREQRRTHVHRHSCTSKQQYNAQFTPPARHDKTVLSVSCQAL